MLNKHQIFPALNYGGGEHRELAGVSDHVAVRQRVNPVDDLAPTLLAP
jgi:hypothetical protein